MRLDLSHIQRWIDPGSRVLDLGCGDGVFLESLRDQRQVRGTGLEIDREYITAAIARGINVVEQNMDESLANFPDHSFDTVVLVWYCCLDSLPRQTPGRLQWLGARPH